MTRRLRAVVCGTGFGRVYLAALRRPDAPFEVAGIVARGSERSRACARASGVPLYTNPDEIPDDVEVACVVVGGAVNGGPGAQLARQFLARGIHVLQEHPLHHDELAACVREARARGVAYQLNTHYLHVGPIRRFIVAARALAARQRVEFADAAGGLPTAFALLDILGRALGGLRPWGFSPSPDRSALRSLSGFAPPFTSLNGMIAGVPVTLRVQNQLAADDPDNHAYFFFRITLGTEGGTLSLVDSHGPVVWCPRPHLPPDSRALAAIEDSPAAHLDLATATLIGSSTAPSYRDVVGSLWPAAVRHALDELRDAIVERRDPVISGQYYLSLCRLWQDVQARLGPVEIIWRSPPDVLGVDAIGTEEDP